MDVRASDDGAAALAATRAYLEAEPVGRNLVLTLLHGRASRPEPGRYWWAVDRSGSVVGVVFQSPPTFPATITPCAPAAVDALVDAIAGEGHVLSGVSGEVATAARFAGRWASRTKMPAAPAEGQRLYRLGTPVPPAPVGGALRLAGPDDRARLAQWIRDFAVDTGMPLHESDEAIDHRLSGRRWWIWEDAGEAVSSALASPVAAGVSRVGLVYTPPEHRRRGYAAACVAAIDDHILNVDRAVPILYTQLANPTSNAVYQRLGYEPVLEVLSYRFG
jgi:GNAT superfamily N-acetyltransferase